MGDGRWVMAVQKRGLVHHFLWCVACGRDVLGLGLGLETIPAASPTSTNTFNEEPPSFPPILPCPLQPQL